MKKEKKKSKESMVNITINIPEIYDKNIQKLIKMKRIPSRSEGIRIALREYLHREYQNLKLFGFFEGVESEKMNTGRVAGVLNLSAKITDLQTKLKGRNNLINYLKSELDRYEMDLK